MIIKQFRLSNKAKDQLIRLKGKTGIQQWNILCRWALCLSLNEKTVPPYMDNPPDSNLEMTWQVFAGDYADIYEALIVQRCLNDGLSPDSVTLSKQFRLHLHRGIGYLAGTNFIKDSVDLLELALEKRNEGRAV